MVRGIELFRDYFAGHEDKYTVIGGTACDLLMEDAGFAFRATKDLDVVLIVEMLDDAFATLFWQFIHDGAYQNQEKSTGKQQFYRFSNPADTGFPFMIELFSRKPDHFLAKADTACVPIHISDEVSSLSAILLDADYYQLLLDGRTKIAGVPILTAERLIPFKAKAWLDLTEKNESGQHIDTRDITKHKNDVYRLSYLLNEDMICKLHGEVERDMKIFLEKISQLNDADSPVFKRLKKNDVIRMLMKVYGIKN